MSPRPFRQWQWEDAFDKFGFDDGDGPVGTGEVEQALNEGGFATRSEGFGLHNTVIVSIIREGVEFIPQDNPNIVIGYDDPRDYLPAEIVDLLDGDFP